jgi:glucose uptake protein
MITPTTYTTALFLLILSMLCWGSWANTFKMAGKWRFELFYYDYALGVLIAAIVAAYTFGTLGSDLSFSDNLLIAGRRNQALGAAAGVVFNLANMLLVAAISIAGMAVAFPVGIGLALVIGVIWNYILNPQGNQFLLAAGVVLVVGAIIVDAIAYGAHARAQKLATAPGASPQRARTKADKGKSGAKGLVLSLVSGVLMGSFYPLVQMGIGQGPDYAGLGPYAVAFWFAIGVFVSTFIFNLYFLNLPVEGEPISMSFYLRGTPRQHLLGILGGLIWCTGAIANFVAASTPKQVQVGPAISYAIGQGATLISALWGLLVWKEFAGANSRVKAFLAVMLLLFVAGLALLSLAPIYAG